MVRNSKIAYRIRNLTLKDKLEFLNDYYELRLLGCVTFIEKNTHTEVIFKNKKDLLIFTLKVGDKYV